MRAIIGIGTGRTGTHSLAQLLNAQENTICFHEINPACMKWSGTEVTVSSMLREFEDLCTGKDRNISIDYTSPKRNIPLEKLPKMGSIEVVGDIALYYLTYVPFLCSKDMDIRIPCIKRNKDETVNSFIRKMKVPISRQPDTIYSKLRKIIGDKEIIKNRYRNHWIEHDGSVFEKDMKWDKCFPKFDAKDLREALGLYWDYYYEKANYFERKYPDKVRIFDIEDLNNLAGKNSILSFCGYTSTNISDQYHTNKAIK